MRRVTRFSPARDLQVVRPDHASDAELLRAGDAEAFALVALSDGAPVQSPRYKLSVNGAPKAFLDGTAYVSRSDYHPLEIDTIDGGGEKIVYGTYEYLPATPNNLKLLDGAGHAARPDRAK